MTDWAARTGPEDRALVLLGDPGTGKSVMLADLATHAGARGLLVLSVSGLEEESELAFAGLRQLLRPLLAELLALPGPLAGELRTALGLDPPLAGCDRFRTGTALLELLAGPSGRSGGLLLLVDDAHWLDAASLDVLAFAARRLDRCRTAIVITARGAMPPPGMGSGIPARHVITLRCRYRQPTGSPRYSPAGSVRSLLPPGTRCCSPRPPGTPTTVPSPGRCPDWTRPSSSRPRSRVCSPLPRNRPDSVIR
jgi:hypothetical protein